MNINAKKLALHSIALKSVDKQQNHWSQP